MTLTPRATVTVGARLVEQLACEHKTKSRPPVLCQQTASKKQPGTGDPSHALSTIVNVPTPYNIIVLQQTFHYKDSVYFYKYCYNA